MPQLHLLVPGDIETKTGGYGYDREIVAGLKARGWSVQIHSLPGLYPAPSDVDRESASRVLGALPAGALVLVDGLAFGALPAEAARHRSRLRLVALVHHPLGHETGIDALTSLRLFASERQALASARGAIVTSSRTVSAVESLGVSRDRIDVVEPGTHPAPVARGSHGGVLEMLCVASLVPRKGHDTLFNGLEHLLALGVADWHLTCVGRTERGSEYGAELIRRIGDPLLAGRVTAVGELAGAALHAAYDRADLFVLPTHYEGYGMAVAEALARGIPVVSTPTGAIAELVGKSAGVLIPPGDPFALASALQALLLDYGRLAALREGALRTRSRFQTWETACARMEQALARLGGE
jgi:glycosyltransferase involved in cell wall biosynthesis